MPMVSATIVDPKFSAERQGESAYCSASEGVKQFCSSNKITSEVIGLANLASQHMSGCQEVSFELQSDSETDNAWVVVEAKIGGSENEVIIQDYKATLQAWIALSTDGVRDLIKFTFSLA
jgi:hypothetical protein